MSDLKPPSQNRPGPPPSSRRIAIRRSLEPVPQFKKFRQECVIGPAEGQTPVRVERRARGGLRGESRAAAHRAERARVSPHWAAERKWLCILPVTPERCRRTVMAVADLERPKAIRGLPGATVL